MGADLGRRGRRSGGKEHVEPRNEPDTIPVIRTGGEQGLPDTPASSGDVSLVSTHGSRNWAPEAAAPEAHASGAPGG